MRVVLDAGTVWLSQRRSTMTMLDELITADATFDERDFIRRLRAIEERCRIRYMPQTGISKALPIISDERCEDLVVAYHSLLDETSLVVDTTRWGNDLDLVFDDRWRYAGSARAWAEMEAEWANHTRFLNRGWDYVDFYMGCLEESVLQAIARFAGLVIQCRAKRNGTEYWALVAACAFCEQGSALMTIKCPQCHHVFAACCEAGCVIPDITDLGKMASWPCDISYSATTKCPSCEVVADMLPADNGDLAEYGLGRDEVVRSKA